MTLKILRNYLVGAASNEYVFNRHITIGRLRKVGWIIVDFWCGMLAVSFMGWKRFPPALFEVYGIQGQGTHEGIEDSTWPFLLLLMYGEVRWHNMNWGKKNLAVGHTDSRSRLVWRCPLVQSQAPLWKRVRDISWNKSMSNNLGTKARRWYLIRSRRARSVCTAQAVRYVYERNERRSCSRRGSAFDV